MLGDPSRIRLAYSLLLALPGAPVLRYGEEIGMGENLRLKERDAVRTPMQWSDEKGAGFSTADELVRPVIASGPYGFESVNVDAQLRDESSLLRWLMKMIGVRKQAREIGGGRWRLLPVRGASVLALRYDLDGSGIVTLHNFDDRPHDVSIDVDGDLSSLLDEETHSGAKPIALDAFGYRWYRIRSRRP
jgi:maltose alpha-D-glucosyltransferase/alpha-amylase